MIYRVEIHPPKLDFLDMETVSSNPYGIKKKNETAILQSEVMTPVSSNTYASMGELMRKESSTESEEDGEETTYIPPIEIISPKQVNCHLMKHD